MSRYRPRTRQPGSRLEAVRTYEGTDEAHTLILGEHLTGIGAFR